LAKKKRIISLYERGFAKAEIERKTGVSGRSVGRILDFEKNLA
jgi:DNA invertase Pin-like site-specific DNA recombinase